MQVYFLSLLSMFVDVSKMLCYEEMVLKEGWEAC